MNEQLLEGLSDTLKQDILSFKIDTLNVAIKDIKANAIEPFSFSEILPLVYLLLGLIALAIAIYYGYVLYRKYKKDGIKELFAKPKPKLPAHIIAINSLESLRLKRLCENGRVKEYYSEISDIIRQYLFDRYKIRAIEMTFDEIMQEIKSINLSSEDLSIIDFILSKSDLVKFAKYIPEDFIADRCMNESINFVEHTKFIEEEGKEEKND